MEGPVAIPLLFSPLKPFTEPTSDTRLQAAKIGKEYEAKGGDYENEPGSKNKPQKGPPEKKSEEEKKSETKVSNKEDGLQNLVLDSKVRSGTKLKAGPLPKLQASVLEVT